MDLCISPAVPGFKTVELSVDMAICVFVFLTHIVSDFCWFLCML